MNLAYRNLYRTETLTSQDPYLKLWITTVGGPETTVHKTKIHNGGDTNAVWQDSFFLDVEDFNNLHIYFVVMNSNSIASDKVIGRGSIPCSAAPENPTDMWVKVYREDSGAEAGDVCLSVSRLGRIVVEAKAARFVSKHIARQFFATFNFQLSYNDFFQESL